MENTYQPPFTISREMHASKGQRFANYLIDWVIQYILMMVLLFVIFLLTGDAYVDEMGEPSLFITYLVAFIVMLLYYTLMETAFSKTLGKFITQTKVVTREGEKPDSGTVFQRTLCRIIPFDALSFFGEPGKGWHDSISRTYVVKIDSFETGKELHRAFGEIGNQTEPV